MHGFGNQYTRKPYPNDVSDKEWEFLTPYLTLLPLDAEQRRHDLREVFNALRSLNIKANEKALAEEEAGRRKSLVETLSEKQADFDEKAAPGMPASAAPGKGKGDDDDEGGSGSSGSGSAPAGDHGPDADNQEENHDRERVR